MKKFLIIFSIFIIILTSIFFTYNYSKNLNKISNEKNVLKENNKTEIEEQIKDTYIDDNPIKVGLYKYYGKGKDRELINEYKNEWTYYNDISSFEVFYTNENFIESTSFQDTFYKYLSSYENIANYKIGFNISFNTLDKQFDKQILTPKDTLEFFEYLEIYLYDDYHVKKGVWYSHILDEQITDKTLLTSIKLTTGKKINEIISDIKVSVFTYDEDDFDELGIYKGNSKYTITVKNPNI